PRTSVQLYHGPALMQRLPQLEAYALRGQTSALSRHPRWLTVLEQAFQHTAYALEAVEGSTTRGFLPLAFVRSLLFGRYLVSLPYLISGGILADDEATARLLIDRALRLADDLQVRHLELRHEQPIAHSALNGQLTTKVHMRLALPSFVGPLWEGLSAK